MFKAGTSATWRTLAVAALIAAMVFSVDLTANAHQAQSDRPLFVTGSVDNDQPYIGQQITFITKIYQRSGFPHTVHYEPPDFAGFWNVGATEQDEYIEMIESHAYRVIELRTLLFPSIVGAINIQPATLTFLDGTSESTTVVEGTAVAVMVRPIPPGAPKDYKGAVGRFVISAEVDSTTGRLNESVTLRVQVKGEGNIDALPNPPWPEFQGWRVSESSASTRTEVLDGRLVGSRTFENLLVPRTTGDLTVPEISYTYFDPELEEYVQSTTSSIAVSISAEDGVSAVVDSSTMGIDEGTSPVTTAIKEVPTKFGKSSVDIVGGHVYWAVWALPLLVIFGAAVWRRKRDAEFARLADSRRLNALPNAQSALARASVAGEDSAVAVAESLLSYLSDRFGESFAGLTRETLGMRLQHAGVPSDLVRQVDDALALGEAAKYAPEPLAEDHDPKDVEHVDLLLIELDAAIET